MYLLTLYQRDDCKLCDEAVALLASVHSPDFESVWIDDHPELEARYGERVPVLRDDASGRELGWPFDAATLRAFLTTMQDIFKPSPTEGGLGGGGV